MAYNDRNGPQGRMDDLKTPPGRMASPVLWPEAWGWKLHSYYGIIDKAPKKYLLLTLIVDKNTTRMDGGVDDRL